MSNETTWYLLGAMSGMLLTILSVMVFKTFRYSHNRNIKLLLEEAIKNDYTIQHAILDLVKKAGQ